MKGFKIKEDVKQKVLALYRSGESYSSIQSATGVSKATISGVVKEKASEDPDLVATHSVAVWCQKNKRAPESLLRSIAIEEEIHNAGSDIEEVVEKLLPYIKKYGDKSAEYAECGSKYAEIVGPRGWSFNKLVEEHAKIENALAVVTSRVQEQEALEEALSQKVDEKLQRLNHVEELEEIASGLRRLQRSPKECVSILRRCEKLLAMGLSDAVMETMAEELKKRNAEIDTAVAAIADLVSRYGSLERACNAEARRLQRLQMQRGNLSKVVDKLKEEVKSLSASILDRRRSLEGLMSEYNRMAERHRMREKAMAKELLEREKRTNEWCAQKEKETMAKCSAMILETKARAKEVEEEARGRVEALERKELELQKNFTGMLLRYKEMSGKIQASEALWDFLTSKREVEFSQLQALYGLGGAFEGMPLPDQVRSLFADAVKDLLTADAKVRLNAVEERVQRSEKLAGDILKAAFEAKARMEARVDILLKLNRKLQNTELTFDSIMRMVLSEPEFVAEALRSASKAYLVEVFARASPLQRMEYRSALEAADEREEMELDRQIEALMKAAIVSAVRSAFTPIPMFPGLPSFTPNLPALPVTAPERGRIETVRISRRSPPL